MKIGKEAEWNSKLRCRDKKWLRSREGDIETKTKKKQNSINEKWNVVRHLTTAGLFEQRGDMVKLTNTISKAKSFVHAGYDSRVVYLSWVYKQYQHSRIKKRRVIVRNEGFAK